MTDLTDTELTHLRRAIAIAAEAGAAGEEPYGSLLVDAGGRVLAEEHNTVLSTADVTAHPELKLGRLAGRLPEEVARGSTLYTSCEPCAMCGEVLARGRVGRVIFALSEEQSRELEGPPNRQAPASTGPALYDEGIAAIGDFYSRPAQERPASPERRFGWWDMFVHPDEDPRYDGTYVGERTTLEGFLHDQRLTLELKCAGLTAEQMARRSVEPSNLSLLGLVRHMAGVEQVWFRLRMTGQPGRPHYRPEDEPNGDFENAVADPEMVAEAWRVWREEVAFAERLVTETPDLGFVGKEGDALRQVMVHVIEEYARHNGHADFLRERIDGRVGQ